MGKQVSDQDMAYQQTGRVGTWYNIYQMKTLELILTFVLMQCQ